MMTQDTIAAGGDRIRIGPHRGSDHTAMLVPVDVRGILNEQALAKSLDALRQRGYSLVVTWALGPAETRPFLAAGFETHHELHLMTRDLEQHPATTPVERGRLRAVRRTDWNQVLDVDRAAFDSFWQFDHDGIRNALKATPSRRFQLTRSTPSTGYHITGRAGPNGYLQRLAVDPRAQRQGTGRLLLNDSMAWLERAGVSRVFVNTQLHNTAAFSLYEAEWFRLEDHRLSVLQFDLKA